MEPNKETVRITSQIHFPTHLISESTITPTEIGEILAQNYTQISADSNYDPAFIPHKQHAEDTPIDFSSPLNTTEPQYYNDKIQESEVRYSIGKCSKTTAPGDDQIINTMLQKLHPNAITFFTKLVNRIFQSSTYPSSWKCATIVPLLKPLKDPNQPQSYRPISLLSSLSKILERILNRRLSWYLEANNLLNQSQYGFRKGRSSTMALAELDAHIHLANSNNANLYSVFLDLENAFPRVWRHHILATIHKIGLRGLLPQLLQNYLKDRNFRVRVAGHLSSVHIQENGIPQGSPLSGSFFMIAINHVFNAIQIPAKPILFADDLSIHVQSSCVKHAHKTLQNTLTSSLGYQNTASNYHLPNLR